MSAPEIQRYAPNFINLKYPDQVMIPLGTGEYVTYTDHVAALTAAVAAERKAKIAECFHHQDMAEAAERERIRKAVKALMSGANLKWVEAFTVLLATVIDNEEKR